MIDAKLTQFAATVLRTKRIRFGDVRRLSRDILPRGIADRGTAESLLALDRAIDRSDPSWTDYLASAIRDFVVSRVDSGEAWLNAAIGPRPTKAGRAIERELALGRELFLPAPKPAHGLATPDEPTRPFEDGEIDAEAFA